VVDHFRGSNQPEHQAFLKTTDLRHEFDSNILKAKVSRYVAVFQNESVRASRSVNDGSIAFVFIDASHECEDVKADIEAWLPKVKPGGVLAGHDYSEQHRGVKWAVDLMLGGKFEVVGDCWVYRVQK
jgi:hypothetical protein